MSKKDKQGIILEAGGTLFKALLLMLSVSMIGTAFAGKHQNQSAEENTVEQVLKISSGIPQHQNYRCN